MRALILLAILAGGALYALKHPWVGVMLWTWVSLMSPHVSMVYGAADWPVAQVAALTTLAGLMFTRERRNPFDRPAMMFLLAFNVWICITLPFSIYFDNSLPLWDRSMKIFLMIFVTVALIDNKRKLDWFIWVCTLSIAYFGIKGGVFTLKSGGNYRVWGPGGFLGGNNEIGLAIVMVIPFLRYLQLQLHKPWARHAMTGAMLLCAVTAIGTYSRGAFLAVGCMALFLWFKSKGHKILSGFFMLAAGALILSVMPEHWWNRMDTIGTYQEDDSALGRINAWKMAWNLAQDKVFGGGFQIYTRDVFTLYSPDPERVHAAHSIYFQVMGEHGFIGLFLFLAIGIFTWVDAGRLIKIGDQVPQHRWAADLGRMVQVSMVGFAVGGAFLSLAYFDMPYNVTVMVVCAMYVVRRAVRQTQSRTVPMTASIGRA